MQNRIIPHIEPGDTHLLRQLSLIEFRSGSKLQSTRIDAHFSGTRLNRNIPDFGAPGDRAERCWLLRPAGAVATPISLALDPGYSCGGHDGAKKSPRCIRFGQE